MQAVLATLAALCPTILPSRSLQLALLPWWFRRKLLWWGFGYRCSGVFAGSVQVILPANEGTGATSFCVVKINVHGAFTLDLHLRQRLVAYIWERKHLSNLSFTPPYITERCTSQDQPSRTPAAHGGIILAWFLWPSGRAAPPDMDLADLRSKCHQPPLFVRRVKHCMPCARGFKLHRQAFFKDSLQV